MATSASQPASTSDTSSSPLTPLISSTRSLVSSGVESVADSEHSAATYWNTQIAKPANQQLLAARSDFHRLRERYGGPAVLASTAAVFAVSLPFGRFAALRNATLTALAVGWTVRPSLVTGLIAVSSDGVAATKHADFSKRGEQIVTGRTSTQQPTTAAANSASSVQ